MVRGNAREREIAIDDQMLQQVGLREAVDNLIGLLLPREQVVVRAFYGIGAKQLTMAEIAAEHGWTRHRVRQIRKRAERRLRETLYEEDF